MLYRREMSDIPARTPIEPAECDPIVEPIRALPVDGTRPEVRGKFLYVDDVKIYVKGVTYGSFRPDDNGCEYHDPSTVSSDFAAMASLGCNTVRTDTVPLRWFLDETAQRGLRLIIGLPWEQHVTFLDDRRVRRRIRKSVGESIRRCAGHSAVLAYTVGNEIPAPIVRWHGRRPVERFLEQLYGITKNEDDALVTYVNYPTTEYLQLPFCDFNCFNVYLEKPTVLSGYFSRLQNLAGDCPLIMAEIGLDSLRHGEQTQAETLTWQIETTFAAGCAGTFLFAWTDEWHRGGLDIDDWEFGLNPAPPYAQASCRVGRPNARKRAGGRLRNDAALHRRRVQLQRRGHHSPVPGRRDRTRLPTMPRTLE